MTEIFVELKTFTRSLQLEDSGKGFISRNSLEEQCIVKKLAAGQQTKYLLWENLQVFKKKNSPE